MDFAHAPQLKTGSVSTSKNRSVKISRLKTSVAGLRCEGGQLEGLER